MMILKRMQQTSVSTRAHESLRGWARSDASYSVLTWGKLFIFLQRQGLKHQVGSLECDRDHPCPCRRSTRIGRLLPCDIMTKFKCRYECPRLQAFNGKDHKKIRRRWIFLTNRDTGNRSLLSSVVSSASRTQLRPRN